VSPKIETIQKVLQRYKQNDTKKRYITNDNDTNKRNDSKIDTQQIL
jgi:hypothetical protein